MPDITRGTVTSTDGTSIAWTRQGTASQTVILVEPVMMRRGFTAFTDLTPALAEHLSVVTYDRRGRGDSTDASDGLRHAQVEREVDDLAALVEAHGGRAHLYGFSSGATLALRAAAACDAVASVVAVEPPLGDGNPVDTRALTETIADLVEADRRGDAIRTFNRSIGMPDEVTDQMPTAPGEPTAHTIAYDIAVTATTVADLGGVSCPTLLIASSGSDERLTSWAQAAAAGIEGAQYRELPGGWHGPDPASLLDAVTTFVAAHPA